jgi:cytidyltransferase-like protein
LTVEPGQILQEIRDSQIYSPSGWQEYLACFTHSVQVALARPWTNSAGGEISRRICQEKASICETLDPISPKMITPSRLLEEKRRDQVTLGVVSGCFDLLHLGHVKGMQYAKGFLSQFRNGKLCVLCLSDRYIRMKKGKGRPILNADERLKMIAAVDSVDYVVLLDAPDCLRMLECLKPDWYLKSEADLEREVVRRETDRVQELGGRIHLFPESVSNITSTTEIVQKVRRRLCLEENL